MPNKSVRWTDGSFEILDFTVRRKGKKIGYMRIWHNANGAHAHFIDTVDYKKGF